MFLGADDGDGVDRRCRHGDAVVAPRVFPKPAQTAKPFRLQVRPQINAGVRALDRGDFCRRAHRDDLAAFVAAFGAEIDDVVGAFDDFQIVLDDDDRVALVDQLVKRPEQPLDIVEVQAGGRLVENKQRAGLFRLGHVRGQFQALRFAARKRRQRLAQADIFQADGAERVERIA